MKTTMNSSVTRLVLLGLLTAIMLVMSFTPLGYLNIGPLAITLNVVPLAIAAVTLGPVGGAIVGAVFGLTSFLQCIGIGGTSAMGVICFEINPFFAFLQRFLPRFLDGLLVGLLFQLMNKYMKSGFACAAAGFLTAFLNTVLFMAALILLYGNTEYLQEKIAGQNLILFVCSFVGINAVFEMIASTLLVGAIGEALFRSKLVTYRPAKQN